MRKPEWKRNRFFSFLINLHMLQTCRCKSWIFKFRRLMCLPLHRREQFCIYNVILSRSPWRQQQVHLCLPLLGWVGNFLWDGATAGSPLFPLIMSLTPGPNAVSITLQPGTGGKQHVISFLPPRVTHCAFNGTLLAALSRKWRSDTHTHTEGELKSCLTASRF